MLLLSPLNIYWRNIKYRRLHITSNNKQFRCIGVYAKAFIQSMAGLKIDGWVACFRNRFIPLALLYWMYLTPSRLISRFHKRFAFVSLYILHLQRSIVYPAENHQAVETLENGSNNGSAYPRSYFMFFVRLVEPVQLYHTTAPGTAAATLVRMYIYTRIGVTLRTHVSLKCMLWHSESCSRRGFSHRCALCGYSQS